MKTIQWRRWLIRAGLWLAFWTLLGLAFACQFYLNRERTGWPLSWPEAVRWCLEDWYVWALLSLPILWLARRFPIGRQQWAASLLIHLGASAVTAMVYSLLRAWVDRFESWSPQPVLFALVYWEILFAIHAYDYYRKYTERERRTSELEKLLTQAQLRALQMQLNPHFLFNTLHSISSLMHTDVEAADRMITRFSDLLRHALDTTDAQEVPLRQELDFLQQYLEIEQTRFGERLKVEFDIAPDTLEAGVPNLILQPLVENAIRHGIEPHARVGVLELCARRRDEFLELEVRDNGGGVSPEAIDRERVGLSNTRNRLGQLFGENYQFALNGSPGGGTRARLSIPFTACNRKPAAQSETVLVHS